MSSVKYSIANPMYDLTFHALFGPEGEVVNEIGGKERLISFLNSIYTQETISFVDYIEIETNSQDNKLIQFDIMCKCYNSTGNNLYDVTIQRRIDKESFDDSYLSSAQLLRYKAKQNIGIYEIPQIRVLSILPFLLDSSQPGILEGQIVYSTTKKLVNNDILWTQIQLPKLLEEGTNNQWLQLLAKGIDLNQPFLQIENTNSDSDAFDSGISILNSYTMGKKRKKVSEEAHEIFTKQMVAAYHRKQIIDELDIRSQNQRNDALISVILHFKLNQGYSSEGISNLFNIPLNYVNFVFDIAELSQNYLNYCTEKGCDPQYSEFFEEICKQFEISDKVSPENEQVF